LYGGLWWALHNSLWRALHGGLGGTLYRCRLLRRCGDDGGNGSGHFGFWLRSFYDRFGLLHLGALVLGQHRLLGLFVELLLLRFGFSVAFAAALEAAVVAAFFLGCIAGCKKRDVRATYQQ